MLFCYAFLPHSGLDCYFNNGFCFSLSFFTALKVTLVFNTIVFLCSNFIKYLQFSNIAKYSTNIQHKNILVYVFKDLESFFSFFHTQS